ncbi:MAG: hypothetical protein AAF651_08080 [Cyanobacteria bacterium P01_C01_bin.73]
MRFYPRVLSPAACWLAAAIATTTVIGGSDSAALAQVQGSCFVEDEFGQVFDLSMICGGTESSSGLQQRPVLQTGDVQVTLEWSGFDDLDLFVVDPAGDTVAYFNPRIPSGGQLDVDANAACNDIFADPVENIFWPEGQSPSGEFTVIVSLFSLCSDIGQPDFSDRAIDFSVRVLVQGEIREYSGTVSPSAAESEFSFTSP